MEEILNYRLFKIGKITFEINQLLLLIGLLVIIRILLAIVQKFIYKNKKLDSSTKYTIYTLFKYIVYVGSIMVCFDIIGVNVSIFLAGSAALLVGVGLGLQNLLSDFISGIILLLDRSIKIEDIIEVNGMVCKVKEINLRTTTVRTRDERNIILPNTDLTKNHLINWTHDNGLSRFDIKIGIAYNADLDLAIQIMENAAQRDPQVSSSEKPFCRLEEFSDSSVVIGLYFWTQEVFGVENTKSRIRLEIFKWFISSGIEIPFPQRVVHFPENIS